MATKTKKQNREQATLDAKFDKEVSKIKFPSLTFGKIAVIKRSDLAKEFLELIKKHCSPINEDDNLYKDGDIYNLESIVTITGGGTCCGGGFDDDDIEYLSLISLGRKTEGCDYLKIV